MMASQPSSFVTPLTIHGDLGFLSGQLPRGNGELLHRGQVGAEVTIEQAIEAADLCARNCLAVLERELAGRATVARILKVTGFVASAPGFNGQPQVIDGASRVFIDRFGDAGRHARSAVGVAELPHGAPVEIEIVVALGTVA